ncbi:hypothetical protein PDK35_07450 [Bacillus cereus group sp. TH153LC]|uniref:hypothetical protein n=1 Tax=Bacillus cereus group sp. TH153LC TaxID=3018059 RepID=UPI0022E65428|nr:hypothetical protein [Bacillus cereus group sp. TH153LC]MDA1659804.1 hypothetical protein [Bacillus cereus group sp. TH153LC]
MENIISSLLGAIFSFLIAIYNALCPIFSQEITILVIWKQVKYHFLGLLVIFISLLLTLILRYQTQTLWREYYHWLLNKMINHYFETYIYHVAA